MDLEEEIEDETCSECGGTGEVSIMESVWPNEPYTADVGSQACPSCTLQNNDDL